MPHVGHLVETRLPNRSMHSPCMVEVSGVLGIPSCVQEVSLHIPSVPIDAFEDDPNTRPPGILLAPTGGCGLLESVARDGFVKMYVFRLKQFLAIVGVDFGPPARPTA